MRFKDLDDVELVAEMARGDAQALAALYDRYARLMMAVAVRMLTEPSAAEDLVHDVFIEAWRQSSRYSADRASVRTWLLVRLRSRALDQIRSKAVRRQADHRGDDDAPEIASDDEDLRMGPDRARVRQALAELPEAQRQVLELGYFKGLSSAEIAEEIGTPIGTVKSRTAAGLSRLRTVLGPGGGEA